MAGGFSGAVFAALALGFSSHGQAPELVREFETTVLSGAFSSSNPGQFVGRRGRALFTASRPDTGGELFVTSGQFGRTDMVVDLVPGLSGSNVRGITAFGGGWLFIALDLSGVDHLWRSDGTYEGTERLAQSTTLGEIVSAGDRAFFVGSDGAHGDELWVTDGTLSGTRLVVDVSQGASGSSPRHLTVGFDNRVLFSASDGVMGHELWISDGTRAGTSRVTDIAPAGGSSSPRSLAVLSDTVVFRALSTQRIWELWATDGSPAGTRRLDVPLSRFTQGIISVTEAGGLAWFGTDDGTSGYEPWVTNGTVSGTRMLADLNPGAGSSSPGGFTTFAGRVWFSANDGQTGNELWSSDGTTAGTRLERDISPGATGSLPQQFAVAGSTMYFRATDALGAEPWRTDGTAEGTIRVADIAIGPADSDPADFADLGNGEVVFRASDAAQDTEVWSSLGTTQTTVRIADLSTSTPGATLGSSLREGEAFGGGIVFVRYTSAVELWFSDGTGAGTYLLASLPYQPSTPGQFIRLAFLLPVGDRLFFGIDARRVSNDFELWTSDGSPGGARKIAAVPYQSNLPVSAAEYRGKLWVGVDDLIVSDGTAAGTRSLGLGSVGPRSLTPIGNRMLFSADDGVAGCELWATDGTLAGTSIVRDIHPTDGSDPRSLFRRGPWVYLSADDGVLGHELWRSDGTTAGTRLVRDINPGPGDSSPTLGGSTERGVVFLADDGVHGREPWVSDGSASGTRILRDILRGPSASSVTVLGSVRGRVLLTAQQGPGAAVWSSDGTEDGTFRLPMQVPDLRGSTISRRGAIWLAGYDPRHGVELWRTDGSVHGTRVVSDLNPGDGNSAIIPFGAADGRMIFAGDNGVTGVELWRLSLRDRGQLGSPPGDTR